LSLKLFIYLYILFVLGKPQKSFDDLFGETNTKKYESSEDDFIISEESEDDNFAPKSGKI